MTTLNGLPAHILLVHAVVVLLPLASILLVLCASWPAARHRLAGPTAILALLVLVLVPITTDAGEWLETRVGSSELVREHTELGDTAIFVALPVAVLAVLIWWRQREGIALRQRAAAGPDVPGGAAPVGTSLRMPHRAWLRPGSNAVSIAAIVLCVLAGGAAVYDVYLIGDSGARATWEGEFDGGSTP